MIAVIDYGAGNLHSVQNALNYLGAENIITSDPKKILASDKIILPGVGSFGKAMEALKSGGLDLTVRKAASENKPLLGICLGLQLLFEESEESPGVRGLGLFKGRFSKIPDCGLKIPHMGWNNIYPVKKSKILAALGENPYVYFVHSYYLSEAEEGDVAAYTEYGRRLDIAVERGNLCAVQFHPEKSGAAGMKILKNFLN